MNIRLRLLVSPVLYIFSSPIFAHPGPHVHFDVPDGAWHAFIGWEFALALIVIGAVLFLMRHLRNTRTK